MKRTKNESGVKRIITRKEKKKDEENRFMNMEKKLKGKLKTNRKAENCIYFRRHYG